MLQAISGDPDQTPHFAGICLPMSHKKDARLIRDKHIIKLSVGMHTSSYNIKTYSFSTSGPNKTNFIWPTLSRVYQLYILQ